MPVSSNPLAAAYYADRAVQATVTVLENVRIARDTYRLRFECPTMARRFVPGQFLMLRLNECNDPLLGRALALYDVVPRPGSPSRAEEVPFGLDVVYLVGGKLTRRLAGTPPGQRIDVWGPLGNGFPPQPVEHLVMVAGGIGQTPFLSLAREYLGRCTYGDPPRVVAPSRKVTFCYGARTADYLAGLDDFAALGVDVRISTDDGSRGHHGLVTGVLRQVLAETSGEEADAGGRPSRRVVCCGPEPMMEAVAELTLAAGVPCQVSLETPMACGVGICFTCVAKVCEASGGWDYKRTCVEGPVFDAERIVW